MLYCSDSDIGPNHQSRSLEYGHSECTSLEYIHCVSHIFRIVEFNHVCMCKRKRKENPGGQTSDYHRNEYYYQKSGPDLGLRERERAYQKDEYPVDYVEHIPRHQFSGCKNLKVGLVVHSREYIVEFTGSRGHRLYDAVAGHGV